MVAVCVQPKMIETALIDQRSCLWAFLAVFHDLFVDRGRNITIQFCVTSVGLLRSTDNTKS